MDVDRLLANDEDHDDEAAAITVVAVNAAARTVADAVSRWLRDPTDALAYGELITALRRWERVAPADRPEVIS